MARRPKRRFPNISEVLDPRSGAPRGWRAQVWLAGKLKRGKTRETQQQAHDDAVALLDLRERLDDDEPEPTLKSAMVRVLAALDVKGRRPATTQWYSEKFETLKAAFGEDTPLRQVTRQRLQAWIEKKAKTVSPNTVHHYLRALRRIFRIANLPSPTSDSRLVVPDQVPAPTEVMGWGDVRKLLAGIRKKDEVAWGMVGLFAYSGIRRSEAARLRIHDLDVAKEMLHVRHAKVAKMPRSLPMPEGLQEMAAAATDWGTEEDVWVFPGETEDRRVEYLVRLSRRWKVKLHVLRHSFASELARRGVPVHVIARLLGHSMGGTTMRYVHEAMPELRAAMEKLWE